MREQKLKKFSSIKDLFLKNEKIMYNTLVNNVDMACYWEFFRQGLFTCRADRTHVLTKKGKEHAEQLYFSQSPAQKVT